MKYRWQSNYTGEIFRTLTQAVTTAIKDMKTYKACRTIKAFNFSRIK